jgi:galactose-1-phosphate uridylyltransferase
MSELTPEPESTGGENQKTDAIFIKKNIFKILKSDYFLIKTITNCLINA